MRMLVRLQIVGDDGTVVADDEILRLSKQTDRLEALGLSRDEAKRMLRVAQTHLLVAQAGDYAARHRACPACGQVRHSKGLTTIRFRTLFGAVGLPSWRLHHCRCHPEAGRSSAPWPVCSPSMPRRSCCSWRPSGRRWCPMASPPIC